MKYWRTVRLVLIPILFALMVTLVVRQLTPEPVVSEPLEMATVVVAAKDIPAHTALGVEYVRIEQLPADALPEGAVTEVAAIEQAVTLQSLVAGEVLLSHRLAAADGGSRISFALAPGMLAVTVGINEIVGVGGHLRPGDRVDVLWTGVDPGEEYEATRIVLSDVEVVAVSDLLATDPMGQPAQYTSATLVVTPMAAVKLVHADETGRIRLAIRARGNQSDPFATVAVTTVARAERWELRAALYLLTAEDDWSGRPQEQWAAIAVDRDGYDEIMAMLDGRTPVGSQRLSLVEGGTASAAFVVTPEQQLDVWFTGCAAVPPVLEFAVETGDHRFTSTLPLYEDGAAVLTATMGDDSVLLVIRAEPTAMATDGGY